MRHRIIIIFQLMVFAVCKSQTLVAFDAKEVSKPKVSFTFDDGITSDLVGFRFEDWNDMILSHLEKENLKAVFFITGKHIIGSKGQYLLKTWNDFGHKIANHTFSHSNFNSKKNNSSYFERELCSTDSIISKFDNHTKLFRFPYLKEGGNELKVDSLRYILKKYEYRNGYVTIDASDWYVNQRLIARIREKGIDNDEIQKFKEFYLYHILERANYYEKLSYELNARHISHTLLLHHNLTSALFLGDLIQKFKEEGWEVMNANEAYQDNIFSKIPKSSFAGESLVWSMAKQSGKYEETLRYPGEDGVYEKEKMDALGL